MKKAVAIAIAAFNTIAAGAKETVIARRSPACVNRVDIDAFYALAHNRPSMREMSEFRRDHQCVALKSSERVTIEQDDPIRLYYCVRIPERVPCYWARHDALRR